MYTKSVCHFDGVIWIGKVSEKLHTLCQKQQTNLVLSINTLMIINWYFNSIRKVWIKVKFEQFFSLYLEPYIDFSNKQTSENI